MPKLSRPLTDRFIQHLKPGQSATDGASKGLIALRQKDGRIFWRLRLRDETRSTWRSLGEYPATTLAQARGLALTTQAAAVNGGDVDVALARPKAIVKAKAAEELAEHGEQLGKIMEAYLAHYARQWSESNLRLIRKRLEKDVLPKYGKTPIKDIEAADLLMHLQKIHDRAPETSHRIYSILAQLWRFARFNKHTDRSPLDTFKVGEIGKVPEGHLDAIVEPGEFGVLLGAIYRHPSIVTRAALQVSAHCFPRSSELRFATWGEFDLDGRTWTIPAPRMKIKTQDHIIPLSRQVLEILGELREFVGTDSDDYLFPGSDRKRPISNGTLSMALKRLCAKHTQHGFRATFRTLADEVLRHPLDLIEHQLAHTVRDPLGTAYNRTAKLEGRRAMMQSWSDYLDTLRG